MKQRLFFGGLALSFALLLSLLVPALADGRAPVAENLELETYRGVSVGGSLAAKDPDGGLLSFEITTQPGKGSVELCEDGRFVYTPDAGRRGKDYFGYRATDAEGNRSQEATVLISIVKPKRSAAYADTAGTAADYAARRLAEAGIYVGQQVGGEYVFGPDEPITREEFLVTCMLVTGAEASETVRRTGFSDDAAISAWARGYVGAAVRGGLISGYEAEDGALAVFRPDSPITMAEAACILDRALSLTDAVPTWVPLDDTVPAWARQSAVNVSACGLLPAGVSFTDGTLTRGDAAIALVRAMELR